MDKCTSLEALVFPHLPQGYRSTGCVVAVCGVRLQQVTSSSLREGKAISRWSRWSRWSTYEKFSPNHQSFECQWAEIMQQSLSDCCLRCRLPVENAHSARTRACTAGRVEDAEFKLWLTDTSCLFSGLPRSFHRRQPGCVKQKRMPIGSVILTLTRNASSYL